MKINFFPTLISVLGAALLAYLFYTMAGEDSPMRKELLISGFVATILCLQCGIGICWGDSRRQANVFAVSVFFFIVFVAEICCFAYWGSTPAWLVITTGLLALLYLLILYGITKAKM